MKSPNKVAARLDSEIIILEDDPNGTNAHVTTGDIDSLHMPPMELDPDTSAKGEF